jgi:hypothetical protein
MPDCSVSAPNVGLEPTTLRSLHVSGGLRGPLVLISDLLGVVLVVIGCRWSFWVVFRTHHDDHHDEGMGHFLGLASSSVTMGGGKKGAKKRCPEYVRRGEWTRSASTSR